jgi:hypothetical protein
MMMDDEFDVTPISDESIDTTMKPLKEALEKANAVAAQRPDLKWDYTVEADPLNPTRYVLKIVGTPRKEE